MMEAEGYAALVVRGTDDSGIEILDDVDLARAMHVRTEEGRKKYHLPIGSLIVGHDVEKAVEAAFHEQREFDEAPEGTKFHTHVEGSGPGLGVAPVYTKTGPDEWTLDNAFTGSGKPYKETATGYGMRTKRGSFQFTPKEKAARAAKARAEAEAKTKAASAEHARVAGWKFKPGDTIPDTSAKGRAQWLDDAPIGTTIEVTPGLDERAQRALQAGLITGAEAAQGPRRIWTKTSGQSEDSVWQSRNPSGNLDQASNGGGLVGSQWGPTVYRIPPNFGGDIDKVLHPKDGDTFAYTDPFAEPGGAPVTLTFSADDGLFHSTPAVSPQGLKTGASATFAPEALLAKVSITSDFLPGESTDAYLLWSVDADRLDAEFRAGIKPDPSTIPDAGLGPPIPSELAPRPLAIPHGWAQVTPREAFAGDSTMAVSYYKRAQNTPALRLFKGPHGEVVVVDDASTAKFLSQLLDGVREAMELVKDAPGIKDPNSSTRKQSGWSPQTRAGFTTFTVSERWDGGSDALAYVRGALPDDVQVNPGLVNGTYDGGDSSVHTVTPAVRPYKSVLDRLTAFGAYYHYKNTPGSWLGTVAGLVEKQNWWSPASGIVTDNIFTATLTHELGHINDGRRHDTGVGSIDADPKAISFWRAHKGLSQYANTNAAEGYAEAFAEYHFEKWLYTKKALRPTFNKIPPEVRAIAAAYAAEYGWGGPLGKVPVIPPAAPPEAHVFQPYGP